MSKRKVRAQRFHVCEELTPLSSVERRNKYRSYDTTGENASIASLYVIKLLIAHTFVKQLRSCFQSKIPNIKDRMVWLFGHRYKTTSPKYSVTTALK